MKHYEVVGAIIENENGEIFISKRGPGRALENKWEFPGGKVEKNETHEETIIREIKEELNSKIIPIKYIGKSYYEYKNLSPYKDFSITLYAYLSKLIDGKLELSEHIDSKFVPIEQLLNFEFAQVDKPIIKMLIDYKRLKY